MVQVQGVLVEMQGAVLADPQLSDKQRAAICQVCLIVQAEFQKFTCS